MARNIYKQFYGQGNGGYTAEHQLQGRVRRSAQAADTGNSSETEQYVPRTRRAKPELDADDFLDPHMAKAQTEPAPAPAPVAEPVEEAPVAPAPVVEQTPVEQTPVAEPTPVQPAPVAEPVVQAPVQPVAPAPQEAPTPVVAPQQVAPAPAPAPAKEVAPLEEPYEYVEETEDLEIIEEAVDTIKEETEAPEELPEDLFGDDLLAQIDAFRQKAMQLQELIEQKQERAQQLKDIVEMKETQVQGLEGLLAQSNAKNRELAEDLKTNVNGKIDWLHSEMNSQLLAMSGEVKNQIDAVTASLGDLNGADIEGVTNEVKSIKTNMDELQNAIAEKVHSESVASYRNTADLIKDINIEPSDDEKKDRRRLEGQVKGTRGSIRFLTVFSIVNFALLAVLSLFTMGFFSLF